MNPELPQALAREALTMLGVVGGPVFVGMFLAGLVIGVLQAATQVNDPAVGFLPRIAVALAICSALGSWMVERLALFLSEAFQRMALTAQ